MTMWPDGKPSEEFLARLHKEGGTPEPFRLTLQDPELLGPDGWRCCECRRVFRCSPGPEGQMPAGVRTKQEGIRRIKVGELCRSCL